MVPPGLLTFLVVFLTRLAVCQKSISWITALPTGYQLITGDLLRFPLDDYLSLKGAMVQTSDPNGKQIIHKMQMKSEALISQNTATAYCRFSYAAQAYVLLLCQNRYLVRVDINPQAMRITGSAVANLLSASFSQSTQMCTDIFVDNGKAYVPCYDAASTDSTIQLYETMINPMPTNARVNLCPNSIGSVKGNLRLAKLSYGTSSWEFAIWDSARTAPVIGVVGFLRCGMSPDANTNINSPTAGAFNLATLVGNSSLNGTLRYLQGLLNTDVLYVLSIDDPGFRGLMFGVLSVDQATGAITNNTNYNYSYYPIPDSSGSTPHSLSFVTPTMNNLVGIDKTTLHSLTIANVKTSTPNTIAITKNWTVPFDCGLSGNGGVYVGKVTSVGGALDDFSTRLSVEYRFANSHDLKEVAVHFNQSKYGCSRSPGYADGYMQTWNVLGPFTAVSSLGDKLRFIRINPDLLLNVVVPNAPPANNTILITASQEGYTSSSINFTYASFPRASTPANVTLNAPSIKAYSDAKFMLPTAPYNFLMNTPSFKANSSNVAVVFSSSALVSLVTNLTNGYTIHRILSVDVDTFVAVQRKPGSPEGYSLFFTNGTGSQMVILGNTAAMTVLSADGLYVFKAAKVGTHVCLFLKGGFTIHPKLQVTCSADGVGGTTTRALTSMGLANTIEVGDMQFYETSNKLEVLIVATDTTSGVASQVLLYYAFTLVDNVPTFTATPVQLSYSTALLSGYKITDVSFDFWGDAEGTIYVTAKLVSDFEVVLARYLMTYTGVTPSLTFTRLMRLDSPTQAFCVNKNEIIIYEQRKRKVFSVRWDKFNQAGASQSMLIFPVAEYGVQGIIQTNCIPEKGIFQVLGQNTTSKILVNFRGGESTTSSRRVHSVVVLEAGANFIETSFCQDYVMTVSSVPGDSTVNRNFVFTYTNGPYFVVDNTGLTTSYDIGITTSNSESSMSSKMSVEIIQPTYSPVALPNRRFEIVIGSTIILSDEANITGPVMDIVLSGLDSSKVTVTRRKNLAKKYAFTGSFSSSTPDKIFAEKDYMALFFKDQGIKFYGDPSTTNVPNAVLPTLITTITALVKDIQMVPYGIADEAIAVVKIYSNNQYQYNIYCLTKITTNAVPAYSSVESAAVYTTTIDYDTLVVGTVDNGAVFIALSSNKAYVSNYVQLVSFKKNTGATYTKQEETRVITTESREIGEFSLVHNGNGGAVIIARYKGYSGIIVANWDLTSTNVNFVPSSTLFSLSSTDQRMIFVNYIKCYFKSLMKLDCIVDSENIVDYLLEVTLNDPAVKPNADPIDQITKSGEFEVPPQFTIQRIDRGIEHYGFLLKKSQAYTVTRRRLQTSTVESFDTCKYLLVIYSPFRSKYIYTGITCSEFDNLDTVDFSMEWATNDFIYLTKNRGSDSTTVMSYKLTPISVKINDAVDTNEVKFTFVGLKGSAAVTPSSILTLENFRLGKEQKEPPKDYAFWYWIIGFMAIILLTLCLGFLYIKHQHQMRNTAAVESTLYKRQPTRVSDNPKSVSRKHSKLTKADIVQDGNQTTDMIL